MRTIKEKIEWPRNNANNEIENNTDDTTRNASNENEFPEIEEEIGVDDDDIVKELELSEENQLLDDEPNFDVDLDIPGAELDDLEEEIGSEDEENNYYSIGGDNHNDLEEDDEDDEDDSID